MAKVQILSWVSVLMVGLAATTTSTHAQIFSDSAADFWRNEQRGMIRDDLPYSRRTPYGYRRNEAGSYPQRRSFFWNRDPFADDANRTGSAPTEHNVRRPRTVVKSPQYYKYTADSLKTVKFDKLCEVEVASRDDSGNTPLTGLFAEACALTPSISLRVLPEVAKAIRAHYRKHPQFVWLNDGKVSKKALAAIAFLATTDAFGLLADEYRVAPPDRTTGSVATGLKELMRFELALSAKVLTYVLDATRGRIDPNRLSEYHDLPRKNVELASKFRELAEADDVAAYLRHRQPSSAQFRALVAELKTLRAQKPQRPVKIAADTFIRPGDADPELGNVLTAIRRSGSDALKKKHADILAKDEGIVLYDEGLVALVRDFQRENSLSPDGILGKNTIRAMTRNSAAAKIKSVILAMERLRWLPAEFGNRYLFLNQPAFEVTYFPGNGSPLTMPVIIGKKSNQTYVFTDKVETVEYNPYWGVPRSIIINEMLPKLYRNPSYLDRAGYEVTTRSGRRISSSSVDWSRVAQGSLSINVRQPPGNRNALGRVKIDFPNKHAIYMHDTPVKSLFKEQRRAFSHGCVRLQKPRVMAAAILGKAIDDVNENIATGQNTKEGVEGNLPVYLTYFTAWPNASGVVQYYDDVYGRDAYLSRAMETTRQARTGAAR